MRAECRCLGNLNEKKLAVAARAERVFKILRIHQSAPGVLSEWSSGFVATGKYVEPREQALLLLREAVCFNPRT